MADLVRGETGADPAEAGPGGVKRPLRAFPHLPGAIDRDGVVLRGALFLGVAGIDHDVLAVIEEGEAVEIRMDVSGSRLPVFDFAAQEDFGGAVTEGGTAAQRDVGGVIGPGGSHGDKVEVPEVVERG